MTSSPMKLGLLVWNQYTTWPDLRAAGARADALGFDSLWTWDHLYPIVGSDDGPILEGWLTLAAWGEVTKHATLGLMVGANTFRNPALVAKMATTLDHISGGRAARLWNDQPIGTPEMVAERLRPLVELGFRHLIVGSPSPHDDETMERLVREVKPMLEAA